MNHVMFRPDTRAERGEGHLRRCLLLAAKLVDRSAVQVSFVCDPLSPSARTLLDEAGHDYFELSLHDSLSSEREYWREICALRQHNQSVLIVDHYELDYRWQDIFVHSGHTVVVIDDLADRKHNCALLIDPSPLRTSADYKDLVPVRASFAVGARFTLLKDNFSVARRILATSRTARKANLVHVFFGSVDVEDYTSRWSRLLLENFSDLALKVAVGPAYAKQEKLRELLELFPDRFSFTCDVDDMASHMSGCAMAIGAPGTATWERMCLEIPSMLWSTALNQVDILEELDAKDLIAYLGAASDFNLDRFQLAFKEMKVRPRIATGRFQIDGLGAERVSDYLIDCCAKADMSAGKVSVS